MILTLTSKYADFVPKKEVIAAITFQPMRQSKRTQKRLRK
jgi:hypothetical protein